MKYPYIANNNLMFYAKNTATFVGDEDNLNTHGFKITANESKFTNITREYLGGKCVKIESPEHSEFVQELAFKAGFKWREYSDNIRSVLKGDFINFREHGRITFGNKAKGNEQITIPLPPKAESKPKEWPQVGDAVTWGNSVDNFKLLAMHEGSAWAVMQTDGHNDYGIIPVSELKKPKTDAEILRDDLESYLSGISWLDNKAMAFDLLKHYNITKKA